MTNTFYMPPISYMGKGAIENLLIEINQKGVKKALIVTDKVLVSIGLIKKVTDVLEKGNIEYVIFDKTHPNPTTTNVADGLKMFKENNCDFFISVGGGSPHDAAKGMALVAANGGEIKDYEGVDKSEKPQVPLISVNTTAGTASEMTRFCIITDEETHIKMAIVDRNTTPIVAIDDPDLMMDMPKGLTAATGMDALTHAVEAYVSTIANPVTDACAEKAIELIFENLRIAVNDGANVVARENMAYAEYLAGMAFNNASLGYVHAMAHQLGGFYDLPHGVCNAILLPYVTRFNAKTAAAKIKKAIRFIKPELDITNMTDLEVTNLVIEEIEKLSKDVGIPDGTKELGVKEEDFEILATNALKDACALTNPRTGTLEEVIEIYRQTL